MNLSAIFCVRTGDGFFYKNVYEVLTKGNASVRLYIDVSTLFI